MLHLKARFKYNNFSRWDRDAFSRARVSAEARAPFLDLKNSKISQLHFLRAQQAVDYNIKDFLDNLFDINLLDPSHVSDFQHYVFFRHLKPSWSPGGEIFYYE